MSENNPIRLHKSHDYWGRRGGGIDGRGNSPTFKQRVHRIRRPGPSHENKGPSTWSIGRYLAKQAMDKGWLNGFRLPKKGKFA